MTLTQLEYILAVAKEKNFHRAAMACHVTQPTLSTMIKKLEEELGVILFDRSANPTTPTQVGELILKQARVALIETHRITEIISANQNEIKGELRVGIIPTIGPYLLPLFLKHFRTRFPEVELAISELTTENSLTALDTEEIDLAILATKENPDLYFQDHIYDEKMFLYLNPSHPLLKKKTISMSDLKVEEMWLLEEGHCLRDEIIKFCHLRKVEKNRPYGLNIKIGNLEALRYLVRENFGYTLIPELAVKRIPKEEAQCVRPFLAPEPKRGFYFTTRREHLRKALISALKKEVTRSLSQNTKN